MDPSLKRRLFIAIIIVALVVIFLPIPFGHLRVHQPKAQTQDIPPAPQQIKPKVLTTQETRKVVEGFHVINPTPAKVKTQPRVLASQPSKKAIKKTHTVDATIPHPSDLNKTALPPVTKANSMIVPPTATPEKTASVHKPKHAKKTEHHTKQASKHKTLPSPISSIIQKFDTTHDHKPIVVTQSDLLNELPKLHLRDAHLNSSNASVSTSLAAKKNLTAATLMNKAWVVQLGSFADPVRTEKVIKRLQTDGYAAFSYKTKVKNQVKYRVYVGPFLKSAQAKQKLKEIKAAYRLSGYVHQFDAEKLE